MLDGTDLPQAGLLLRAVAFSVDLATALLLVAVFFFFVPVYSVFALLAFPIGVFLYFLLVNPSLGRGLAGIRVVADQGGKISGEDALRRTFGYLALPVSLLVLFLNIGTRTDNRVLHDKWSHTKVVQQHDRPSILLFVLGLFSLLVNGIAIYMGLAFGAFVLFHGVFHDNTRAYVATANAEMRNLGVALESYYIDHGQYPSPAGAETWDVTPSLEPGWGLTPRSLTTPTVYVSSLPNDPFRASSVDPHRPVTFAYRYATIPETCWILVSDGPDEDADIDLEAWVTGANPCSATGIFPAAGWKWGTIYDPSNGTRSDGDVVRRGP